MGESLRSKALRFLFNLYPCFRRTGARLTYIAADGLEVRLRLPLNWTTRGYWGTTFGGSMYAAIDPVFLVMLSRALGRSYLVWDRAAHIDFKRPGRSTLSATFRLDPDDLDALRAEILRRPSTVREYRVDLVDEKGIVHASCVKTLYIRRAREKSAAATPAEVPVTT
ncbi:MAG: DUF4442 domain-containing protein [Geminicoccaceae bacterium]